MSLKALISLNSVMKYKNEFRNEFVCTNYMFV